MCYILFHVTFHSAIHDLLLIFTQYRFLIIVNSRCYMAKTHYKLIYLHMNTCIEAFSNNWLFSISSFSWQTDIDMFIFCTLYALIWDPLMNCVYCQLLFAYNLWYIWQNCSLHVISEKIWQNCSLKAIYEKYSNVFKTADIAEKDKLHLTKPCF